MIWISQIKRLKVLLYCFLNGNLGLQAMTLIQEICTNISIAAQSVGNIDFTVVLRGDSTLRGHFPEVKSIDAWDFFCRIDCFKDE